jgi:O-6-methylguanine DNA methyltransferase
MKAEYTLFSTSLGICGIAWTDGERKALVALHLPEASPRITESRIAKNSSAKKARIIPPEIHKLIKRVRLHLNGELQDFRDVAVELGSASLFTKRAYAAARRIPAGRTMTYGELAQAAGHPGAARAVGQAMGRNKLLLIVPCHRILASGNKLGGFSAHGGLSMKAKMLELEGALSPALRSR